MPRARWSRPRFVLFVLAVSVVGEFPGTLILVALCRAVGASPWLGLVPAALLTPGLLARLWIGVAERYERGLLGALQVLFYGFWGASMVAAVAAPSTWALAWLFDLPPWSAPGAALLVGGAYGILGTTRWRIWPRLRHLDLPLPGLPASLDGFAIVHLSDIHLSGHTPPARLRRWVDEVNRLEPDLIAVTGDLLGSGDHFVDAIAEELGRLRARRGVAVCFGNHDYFCDHERLAARLAAAGLLVLRNRGLVIEHHGARLFLGGVDDTWDRRADVRATLADRPSGLPALILAHDPLLFDECLAHGADVVLAGHTHGGQIASPILPSLLNFARLRYRRVGGHYRAGAAHLHVSRGLGTTGPPLRLGVPSELTLLRLRRREAR